MARGKSLDSQQTHEIAKMLAEGTKTIDIAKKLQLDHRTVKRYLNEGVADGRAGKSGRKKALNKRDVTNLKISLSKMPYDTSKNIFLDAHVKNLGRTARCRYLKTIGSIRKPLRKPKLTTQHCQKRMEWAKKNIKTAFQNVLWTDECRATLDGPDGWAKGWILNGQKGKVLVRRQQGGVGVMFWAGIVGDQLVGPFRVPEGLKMNSDSYCAFLEENLVPWLEEQNLRRRRSIVFQQDNAPSHASKYTTAWRESYGLTADRYMPWPANSPDLNPIENLWSIIKQKVYAGSHQFDSKEDLWDAIVSASQSVEPATIKALTASVDSRLVKLLQSNGGHI